MFLFEFQLRTFKHLAKIPLSYSSWQLHETRFKWISYILTSFLVPIFTLLLFL